MAYLIAIGVVVILGAVTESSGKNGACPSPPPSRS
jgi:hypothetical protein